MFDLKDAEIKDEEAEMILQTGSDVITYPDCYLIRENKMASAGAAIWLPDTYRFFMKLSTMTTRAQQQRNTTATQFDSSADFFVHRPEEYEGTLIVLTTRIEESYGYLNQLLCILNELRCHFQGIAEESERDMDWFEESSTHHG